MHRDSYLCKDINKSSGNSPHGSPLYLNTSFEFENLQEGIEIFQKHKEGFVYTRYGNPSIQEVEDKIAALESFGHGFEADAVMCSSGMGAILTAMLSVLKSGDYIVTQSNLYGGTTEQFLKVLRPMGIDILFVDFNDEEALDKCLDSIEGKGVVYFETPTNPTLECINLQSTASLAKSRGLTTIVDSTLSTPYLQQPLAHGIDLVVHSTTKNLHGHGTSTAGMVVGRKGQLMDNVRQTMILSGTNTSPFEAWLVNQGLKTLALRMDRHCSNAMDIATYLMNHKSVNKVYYPGLSSHETYDTAQSQMKAFGTLVSFEIKGGLEKAMRFMDATRMFTLAPTFGDLDSLALHPTTSSHRNIDKVVREAKGIIDGLIRLSVGIENPEDLIADLERSLSI